MNVVSSESVPRTFKFPLPLLTAADIMVLFCQLHLQRMISKEESDRVITVLIFAPSWRTKKL